LEFRAKLIAALLAVSEETSECEEDILEALAMEIYPDDIYRVEVLINTVHEYVSMIRIENEHNLDKLIFDINRDIRFTKRFRKKIDIDKLKRFLECEKNPDDRLLQERVVDFFSRMRE
jgi:hypothetical protein